MRMPALQEGQSALQRFLFALVRRVGGGVPGPILVMSFRQSFFGEHFSAVLHDSMRKMKHWSVGEVGLFAAFVSHSNKCAY